MPDALPADLRNRYCFPDADDPSASAVVELRAFTHGLMPRTVPERMQQFTEDWRRRGVDAWNEVPNRWRPGSGETVGWWTLPEYLGDHFIAPLLGAPKGSCILQPHVHWTMQCLLSAPEVAGAGDEIVLTAAEFPSTLHSAQQWADLTGLTPRIVPLTDDGFVDPDAVLDAIGPTTALTVLSHVGFTTGERLPEAFLQRVAEATHDAGGYFVVDGYHSAATMPLDVPGLGADVYMGGLLKEASGSSGNAFVYLRDGLDLTPRTAGWFGDADPFGFQPEPESHPDIRRRFMGGTTSVASMYHAVEGVRLLLKAGLDAVRRRSLALTDRCIERADAADLPLRSPRASERRSAMVILEVPEAEALCAHLKAQDIYTDSRKDQYLRMAPFVWNTPAEVDRTFDAIEDALDTGAYRDTALEASGPVT